MTESEQRTQTMFTFFFTMSACGNQVIQLVANCEISLIRLL